MARMPSQSPESARGALKSLPIENDHVSKRPRSCAIGDDRAQRNTISRRAQGIHSAHRQAERRKPRAHDAAPPQEQREQPWQQHNPRQ